MNLYLLTNRYNNGYDTYDSCVVASRAAWSAKRILPYPYKVSDNDDYVDMVWVRPQDVVVELIGTATQVTLEGTVLCSSFNAG